MKFRHLHLLLLAVLLLPSHAVLRAQNTEATASREGVRGQMENVKRLLTVSSGAQRVLNGEHDLAKRIRVDALQRYAHAEKAFDAGDYATAKRLLAEAAQSMFQAVRILGPGHDVAQRKIEQFAERVKSTEVLLEALARISKEEGGQGDAANTAAAVQRTMAAARVLLGQEQYAAARKLLDGGYEIAKAAVEEMRDGKTLVRSLHFSSKEDEYRYELDRNDTHQMLVRVLLREKKAGANTSAMVEQFVRRAGELRLQAEQEARGADFLNAIELLDQSTKELVRAIRAAGLYIPG